MFFGFAVIQSAIDVLFKKDVIRNDVAGDGDPLRLEHIGNVGRDSFGEHDLDFGCFELDLVGLCRCDVVIGHDQDVRAPRLGLEHPTLHRIRVLALDLDPFQLVLAHNVHHHTTLFVVLDVLVFDGFAD